MLRSIKSQKPVILLSFLVCCKKSKDGEPLSNSRLWEKSESKFTKEIDIVYFIRNQMMTQIALKQLFSTFEYFLLKR